MTVASIATLTDAPLLARDDIDYMHALADGDAGPPTTRTGSRLRK